MRLAKALLSLLFAALALAPASPSVARDRHEQDYGQPHRGSRTIVPRQTPRNDAPPVQRYPTPPYAPERYAAPYAAPNPNGRDDLYEPRRDLPPTDPNAHPVRGRILQQQHMGNVVADPSRYRLRRPPPGYHWVYVGRDIYLVQNTTGMIVDQIEGGRF